MTEVASEVIGRATVAVLETWRGPDSGSPCLPGWRQGDIGGAAVNVLQDDPIGLLQWLANQDARWAGGLTVGQWTIGLSCGEFRLAYLSTGAHRCPNAGSIDLHFV